MRPRFFRYLFSALIALSLLAASLQAAAAQADPAAELLSRINALRTQNGLLPLALSEALNTAAQRHSDDMATTGNVSHTGSDGSTSEARIQAAGYGHWRDFFIWGENIYGGQIAQLDDAWNFWINSTPHRNNLLNTRYREIGIGVTTNGNGTYYTLNFGAQPNVLPFFVNGDTFAVNSPDLTLTLGNEDDIPTGEGNNIIGRATQVRIAEGDDPGGAPWQPWAQTLQFSVSNTAGQHVITIEYQDDLQRSSKYSRTISLATAAQATSPAPTETAAPTKTTLPEPTDTPAPTATDTPPPIDTPTPIELTAEATTTPTPTEIVIPFATSTATPQVVAANFPTSETASRLTPPAPEPTATARPIISMLNGAPDGLVPAALGLQLLALIVGAIVVVKRSLRSS
jgi:hypothetical protein